MIVLENDWLAIILFFISLSCPLAFYFKEIRKERRWVDEKLRGITGEDMGNIRKQFLQLPIEERRKILEEQASDPEIVKYYDGLGKNGEL